MTANKKDGKVLIPDNIRPYPEVHEIEIAEILARYYSADVEFLLPIGGYKIKTPDIVMNGTLWEIKSPTGSSRKSTVQSQFKGLRQSRNLIIDGRRTPLSDETMRQQIAREIAIHTRVGRILFITKTVDIFEF